MKNIKFLILGVIGLFVVTHSVHAANNSICLIHSHGSSTESFNVSAEKCFEEAHVFQLDLGRFPGPSQGKAPRVVMQYDTEDESIRTVLRAPRQN